MVYRLMISKLCVSNLRVFSDLVHERKVIQVWQENYSRGIYRKDSQRLWFFVYRWKRQDKFDRPVILIVQWHKGFVENTLFDIGAKVKEEPSFRLLTMYHHSGDHRNAKRKMEKAVDDPSRMSSVQTGQESTQESRNCTPVPSLPSLPWIETSGSLQQRLSLPQASQDHVSSQNHAPSKESSHSSSSKSSQSSSSSDSSSSSSSSSASSSSSDSQSLSQSSHTSQGHADSGNIKDAIISADDQRNVSVLKRVDGFSNGKCEILNNSSLEGDNESNVNDSLEVGVTVPTYSPIKENSMGTLSITSSTHTALLRTRNKNVSSGENEQNRVEYSVGELASTNSMQDRSTVRLDLMDEMNDLAEVHNRYDVMGKVTEDASFSQRSPKSQISQNDSFDCDRADDKYVNRALLDTCSWKLEGTKTNRYSTLTTESIKTATHREGSPASCTEQTSLMQQRLQNFFSTLCDASEATKPRVDVIAEFGTVSLTRSEHHFSNISPRVESEDKVVVETDALIKSDNKINNKAAVTTFVDSNPPMQKEKSNSLVREAMNVTIPLSRLQAENKALIKKGANKNSNFSRSKLESRPEVQVESKALIKKGAKINSNSSGSKLESGPEVQVENKALIEKGVKTNSDYTGSISTKNTLVEEKGRQKARIVSNEKLIPAYTIVKPNGENSQVVQLTEDRTNASKCTEPESGEQEVKVESVKPEQDNVFKSDDFVIVDENSNDINVINESFPVRLIEYNNRYLPCVYVPASYMVCLLSPSSNDSNDRNALGPVEGVTMTNLSNLGVLNTFNEVAKNGSMAQRQDVSDNEKHLKTHESQAVKSDEELRRMYNVELTSRLIVGISRLKTSTLNKSHDIGNRTTDDCSTRINASSESDDDSLSGRHLFVSQKRKCRQSFQIDDESEESVDPHSPQKKRVCTPPLVTHRTVGVQTSVSQTHQLTSMLFEDVEDTILEGQKFVKDGKLLWDSQYIARRVTRNLAKSGFD